MTPDEPPPYLAGTLLRDTYIIQERMAAGGMGEVYAATHVRLPGRLAIKVLAPHLAGDPAAVARFCREAAIASVLRHPHWSRCFDFDVGAGDLPFLVMERLQGRDLAQHLLVRGPLSLERVVDDPAPRSPPRSRRPMPLGIVHRDLKPANVMLVDYEGLPDFVKVLDFGVSKIAGVERSDSGRFWAHLPTWPPSRPRVAARTSTRGPISSPSPCWDTCCSRVLAPFEGQTTAEVLRRIILRAADPLAGRVPWRSTAVERVLTRALSKRPGARFARVTDFAGRSPSRGGGRRCALGGVRPPPPVFQGQSVANLSETVDLPPDGPWTRCSKSRSRSEDVTIDALPLAVDASMAEVA